MKNLRKAAIISAVVLMISIVPAFALNNTNITNGTQDQNQIQTKTQTQSHDCTDQNSQGNCHTQNIGTYNGDQHQYMYGQQNGNTSANNNDNCDTNQHKYQHGHNKK